MKVEGRTDWSGSAFLHSIDTMKKETLDTPANSSAAGSVAGFSRAVDHFLMWPWTRYLLCWCLALLVSYLITERAWAWEDAPTRADGNDGHVGIDFGGQWVMGRMILEGRGRRLYSKQDLKAVVDPAYPEEDGDPKEGKDADNMLGWMIHSDEPGLENLRGPIYPPVHALLYAPFGLLSPRPAYRVMQLFLLCLGWLCGWLIERMSNGRVWWPLAIVVVLCFPNYLGAFGLGQNAPVTLTILLAGWCLLQKGHPWWGGLVWGLLAYKPVWAAAFILGPVLLRRWRFLAAMTLAGAGLVAATLPLVGVSSWFDWLALGRIGAEKYARSQKWIRISRDLIGIPRRWLLDYEGGQATNPERALPTILGILLWWSVPVLTILVALRYRHRLREVTGPGAAFVLLGAYFACYHFMFYDVLLAVLPLTLLFADPRRFLPVDRWQGPLPDLKTAPATTAIQVESPAPTKSPLLLLLVQGNWVAAFALRPQWWRLLIPPVLLALLLTSRFFDDLWMFDVTAPPWDTLLLLGVWLWCGWEVLTRESESPVTVIG
jgi:arabinofuranan 3-O-arabinosyltransferase